MNLNLLLTLLLLPPLTSAFPRSASTFFLPHKRTTSSSAGCPYSAVANLLPRSEDTPTEVQLEIGAAPTFDAARQRISTSGTHRFIAPGPKDLRGPCPGLNALANHGYIARDGVTNWLEASGAATEVFGLGEDLSVIMSLLAVILSGNVLTLEWSIGGPPPQGLLGGIGSILLGRPKGLSGSHNRYETDASAFKGDSYLFGGDMITTRVEYFQAFLNLLSNDDYRDLSVWKAFRKIRTEHSISNNPYFFLGPFSGLVASEAGIFFPPIMFSNHSSEFPGGTLPRNVLYDFYSIKENALTNQLEYYPGLERIPENWYRQPTNSLTTLKLLALIIELIGEYPAAGNIGGNTGTVNSFVGLDLSDLTGGVFNGLDLLDPAKLLCFVFGLLFAILPDMLLNVLTKLGLGIAMNLLSGLLGSKLTGCPVFYVDKSLLEKFPGAGKGPNVRL